MLQQQSVVATETQQAADYMLTIHAFPKKLHRASCGLLAAEMVGRALLARGSSSGVYHILG